MFGAVGLVASIPLETSIPAIAALSLPAASVRTTPLIWSAEPWSPSPSVTVYVAVNVTPESPLLHDSTCVL